MSFASNNALVSIIIPTRDRAWFALRAIAYADRQTYPNIEIIVVDGSPKPSSSPATRAVYAKARTRRALTYCLVDPSWGTGKVRNVACDIAKGEIIVHFDDDDWQSSERVAKQVAAIDAGAELVQTSDVLMWWLERGAARYYHQPGQPDFVLGATLAYLRSYWQEYPYPEEILSEDPPFVRRARELGLRVVDMRDPELLIYLVHGRNTSVGWAELGMIADQAATARARKLMGADVAFYDDLFDLCPKCKPELAFDPRSKGLR